MLGCVAAQVAKMDTRKALTSDSMCAASDMMATLQAQHGTAEQHAWVLDCSGAAVAAAESVHLPTSQKLAVDSNAMLKGVHAVGWCAPLGDVASNNLHRHEDEAQDACYHQLPLYLHVSKKASRSMQFTQPFQPHGDQHLTKLLLLGELLLQ